MKRGFGLKYLQGTPANPRSVNGPGTQWKLGEWQKVEGPIMPCRNGFHCVRENGFAYWSDWADNIFIVEYKGVTVTQAAETDEEKIAAEQMRLVKRIPITKRFVTKLAKRFGTRVYKNDDRMTILANVYWDTRIRRAGMISSQQMVEAILQEYAPEYL